MIENQYEHVEYSRSRIDKSGRIIAKTNEANKEFEDAMPVVDNWRAAHAYPLDCIAALVEDAGITGSKVVRRLKRLDSIVGKLRRPENSGLYRMQDLGGCRVIVRSVEDVYNAVGVIRKSLKSSGHEIEKENDYILLPRASSGYRSYHMVVKFDPSDNEGYGGMRIEIQIRTELQHLWATAVEVLDSVTGNSLKTGVGDADDIRFFVLSSALFSIAEQTTIVEGVSPKKETIVQELYQIDKEKSVRERLIGYNNAIKLTGDISDEAEYYLLTIDMRKKTITVTPCNIRDVNVKYSNAEKIKSKNGVDVVLVAAKSFMNIRECYPNYFIETNRFLYKISESCYEYPEKASIPFFALNNGVEISDYFDVLHFDRNIPQSSIKIYDGIGRINGNIAFCPGWPITLDNSYLRFSGIVYGGGIQVLVNDRDKHRIIGPAIVALSTGACFYLDSKEWYLLCENDAIAIKSREGVSDRLLLFLMGWLKSNVFTWDLVWCHQSNSVFYDRVFEQLFMPKPEGMILEKVIENVSKIMEKEREFVGCFVENGTSDNSWTEEKMIDDFNESIGPILRDNENLFIDYYGLSATEQDTIEHELKLKGYYTY